MQDGDRQHAISIIEGLIAGRAPLGRQWLALTTPLLDWGEMELARRAVALFVRSEGHASSARYQQAVVLARTGDVAAAETVLAKIARTIPDPASNLYLRGTLAYNLGRIEDAVEYLAEAASIRPTSGQIWQTLSSLSSMKGQPDITQRLLAAGPAMASAPAIEQAAYAYAVGKVHADHDEHDDAFAAFSRGAATVARHRPYDLAADEVGAARATSGWTTANLAELRSGIDRPTDRAIVVTGLPRSGSTLVEHILASHSAVRGGEELARFSMVVDLVGGVDAASAFRWASRSDPAIATDLYLHLLDERFAGGGRIVDKTLSASRYLGLLASIMPDAPLFWVQRDPLDCAWSCFRTWFAHGLSWTWSQPALANHFRLERELLARWQDVLGNRLKVIDYESLVREPATAVPAILAHAGLSVEPQVFTPEKTARVVTTNSAAQVRLPINTRAIGAAQPYKRHLQPFIDAYQLT